VQPDGEYEAAIRNAVAESAAGNFTEARRLLERAHALRPSARTLRGLGITAFELRRYADSRGELSAALNDPRTPLTDVQRKEVEELLEKLRPFVGTVKLEIAPRQARLYVDDREVEGRELLLGLGSYQVSVRAPGYREVQLRLVIDGGEELVKRIDLVPIDLSPARQEAVRAHHDRGPGTYSTERDQSDSMLGSFWFWAGIGVVAASGTAVALALALGGGESELQAPYQGNAGSVRGP
jgi:hypothetical protein